MLLEPVESLTLISNCAFWEAEDGLVTWKNRKTGDIVTGEHKISVYLYNDFGRFDKFISLISTYDVLFQGTLQISKKKVVKRFLEKNTNPNSFDMFILFLPRPLIWPRKFMNYMDLIFCNYIVKRNHAMQRVINCKIGNSKPVFDAMQCRSGCGKSLIRSARIAMGLISAGRWNLANENHLRIPRRSARDPMIGRHACWCIIFLIG